jgi:hypothetical protein
MTPDRASEILQPYAENERGPEEEEPRTESDVLWSRLGEEKDVQPNVSDVDPVTGEPLDSDLEDPLTGDLSLEAGDGTDRADMPPELDADEEVGATAEEAATRAHLRERLEEDAVGAIQAADDSEGAGLPVEEEDEEPPRAKLPPKKLKPRRPRIRL